MAVTAPPTRRPPDALSPIAGIESQRWTITLEHLLYIALGVLAILSHLYLLGDRALHHDETHHANFSWQIFRGKGYQHDPLLHGPFLYYLTALHYFIFGDSDYTARLSAASFGIVLTLLPWFLRRDLGRGTALVASAYLLISPVALYVGRFIRHDIFAVVFELIAVIAILRYVATDRPLWHYTLAAAMGLMLATMESFYLFLLIVGSFVVVWLLWQVARQTLWLLGAYLAVAGVALKWLPSLPAIGPIPLPTPDQALLVRHQPDNNLGTYFRNVGGVLGPLLSHPASGLVLASTLVLLVALLWLVFWRRGADGRSAWRRAADSAPVGSLLGALDRVPARQWTIAFGIAFAIYAVFYTAILSNPLTPNTAALVTGVSGSFLYWLGQHGVQRGNQPPHYYLFLMTMYEPLVLLFASSGLGMLGWRFGRSWRGRAGVIANGAYGQQALFAPALLAWWSLGAVAIYSWAGEKMPWLTLHVVVPLALLAAWACARAWHWATRDGFDSLALGLTGMAATLLLLILNRFTITILSAETVAQAAIWPLLALCFTALLVGGLALLYRSARVPLLAVLGLVTVFGLLFTVRSSLRLVYTNGDVPVEPLVFVQTSPDVPRVMHDLRDASLLRTGMLDLPIRYDNETIWIWYFRNYTNTTGSGGTRIDTIDDDVAAVFLLDENVAAHEDQLDGFVRQRYPLRWWFPECEVYRLPSRDTYCGSGVNASSVLSRFLQQPWNGQALADAWRFWYDRKLPAPLGSSDWVLFVRPGLAAELGISGKVQP